VALSEVNGGPWASAAEFSVVGCTDITGTGNCSEKFNDLKAFPVPTSGMFTVSLPAKAGFSYSVYSVSGRLLKKGNIQKGNSTFNFDLGSYQTGIYILRLQSETGTVYRVKVLKK
jgi:hypothetical protein